MENELNNSQDPKEKITNTPGINETGTNNDADKNNPKKKNEGNNPKLPGNDPDQTPEKEVEDPPVANPDKDSDTNYPNRKKIGFNNN